MPHNVTPGTFRKATRIPVGRDQFGTEACLPPTRRIERDDDKAGDHQQAATGHTDEDAAIDARSRSQWCAQREPLVRIAVGLDV